MPRKGYKQTEEHKKKHIQKICGENNGNWKGGIKINNLQDYYKRKSREWVINNPERAKHKRYIDKCRRRGAEGTITQKEWEELLRVFNNKCLCCGKNRDIQKDHIIPIVLGGHNLIANIQPLCSSCNKVKGFKIVDYRMERHTP